MEWIARTLSDFLDLRDWWSICTDSLAQVMVAVSIEIADEISNRDDSEECLKIMEHSDIVKFTTTKTTIND